MPAIAVIFPGQGSQFVGMLQDFESRYPIVKQSFSAVSEQVGYDVWKLVQHGPEDKLNQTEHTQVAMLTADVVIYRILQQTTRPKVSVMAGHSLGEYAALVCAEAIDLPSAALLVAKRGQLMQETVPMGQGAMAAIVGLSDQQVEEICQAVSTEAYQVMPANYNAIGQVVIAGHTEAVEKAITQANHVGARLAKMIPVSVPCHCPLLVPAAKCFNEALMQAPFKIPTVPVISNVDLSIYHSVEQIRTLLKEQLYRPVRWVETIQKMKTYDIKQIIECGPGKILSGLVKRIEKTFSTLNISDETSLENFKQQAQK